MIALPREEGEPDRPLSSEDDWMAGEAASFELPSTDDQSIDDSDEDTVFLAPRLDFTPGGALCRGGDHVDADIESPFAKRER